MFHMHLVGISNQVIGYQVSGNQGSGNQLQGILGWDRISVHEVGVDVNGWGLKKRGYNRFSTIMGQRRLDAESPAKIQ
jgi:hypothetical protein